MKLLNKFVPQTMVKHDARVTQEELHTLSTLAEEGALTPRIERTFQLSEIRAAMDHLASRRTRGKVVVEL